MRRKGVTVTEVKGFGRQRTYRIIPGRRYVVDFSAQVKIDVAVADALLDQVIDITKGGQHR